MGGAAAAAPKKTPKVHGTIQRTTRMLVFVVRPDAPDRIRRRSPTPPFSLRRVNATASPDFSSCRSRNLGAAFHSPATALSPPLRGHRSRPAPSTPHRSTTANPFDSTAPSLRSVSRPIRGEILAGTRFPRLLAVLSRSPRHPLPFGPFQTLRIKAFDRLSRQKLVSRDLRLIFAPRRATFRLHCGSTLETRFVPLDESFREPWN